MKRLPSFGNHIFVASYKLRNKDYFVKKKGRNIFPPQATRFNIIFLVLVEIEINVLHIHLRHIQLS